MRRALVTALAAAAFAVSCASRATATDASPSEPVQRYLGAVRAKRYADAFALLDPAQRAYFRTATNFASSFLADAATLTGYTIAGVRADGSAAIVFVREHIELDDPAHDVRVATTVTVPYYVAGRGASARVGESPGRPWRAFATNATATAGGLRVTVRKLALYAHDARVVVTVQNDGDRFVTVLPDGRSVLRDDDGGIYHPVTTQNWAVTDRQFFLGVRLAPNSRYTGALAFATPVLDDRARRFTLTLGPAVRDGADAPFAVDVAGVVPPR